MTSAKRSPLLGVNVFGAVMLGCDEVPAGC